GGEWGRGGGGGGGGGARSQLERRLRIHLESPQVAGVHADKITSRIQRSLQLFLIVDLAQNIESAFPCLSLQSHQLCLFQRRHDQQHGIGTIDPRFQQLKLIHNKILAQARQL